MGFDGRAESTGGKVMGSPAKGADKKMGMCGSVALWAKERIKAEATRKGMTESAYCGGLLEVIARELPAAGWVDPNQLQLPGIVVEKE